MQGMWAGLLISEACKTGILSSWSHFSIIVWLHYKDSNETSGEKARWELHKDSMCCLEQILEESYNKNTSCTATYPYHINQVRQTRHAGHHWRSKDKLLNVILHNPKHGQHQYWPTSKSLN